MESKSNLANSFYPLLNIADLGINFYSLLTLLDNIQPQNSIFTNEGLKYYFLNLLL